jgi:hypothetical protein
VFFFWEKQLASLRHLFPCQKNTPHPTTDGQLWNCHTAPTGIGGFTGKLSGPVLSRLPTSISGIGCFLPAALF